jgi:hypothetical protein
MTLLLSLLVFAALVLLGYALSALALTPAESAGTADRLSTMAGTTMRASTPPSRTSGCQTFRARRAPRNTSFVAPLVQMIEQAGSAAASAVLLYVPISSSWWFWCARRALPVGVLGGIGGLFRCCRRADAREADADSPSSSPSRST